jgi:hypothetical protein
VRQQALATVTAVAPATTRTAGGPAPDCAAVADSDGGGPGPRRLGSLSLAFTEVHKTGTVGRDTASRAATAAGVTIIIESLS